MDQMLLYVNQKTDSSQENNAPGETSQEELSREPQTKDGAEEIPATFWTGPKGPS